MDELNCNFNQSYIAGSINNLMYATNICIIAPLLTSLQELFDVCADLAVSNVIILMRKRQTECI